MNWGEFVREKRLAAGIGLRQFAAQVGILPSNYNHMEKGRMSPPQGKEQLDQIAEALGIGPGTAEYRQLMDLAVEGKDKLPADVEAFVKSHRMIPVLLRTLNDTKLSQEEFTRLMDRMNADLTTPRRAEADGAGAKL